KVRCPACSTTFESSEAPAAGGAPAAQEKNGASAPPLPNLELPEETEKVDPWKSLNLELSDDAEKKPAEPPARPAPPPRPRRDEDIERPDEDEERPRRRARLNDDHDDLRPCRGCGRMVHRDARRCVSCGERLRDDPELDEDVRYEQRRRKRDWEPHRGGFVLA